MSKPNLIIQMQRMGDLILTFPLMLWLRQASPDRPLWVVAEPRFFEPLLSISPTATYFPPQAAARLRDQSFSTVINLSHRPEAAVLAGEASSERLLGQARSPGGVLRVHGRWQLYRAALVHNNRHNALHWADLNGMDAVSASIRSVIDWPVPRLANPARPRRIGLFVGASQEEKTPAPAFWAALAKGLLDRGCRPLFLGGPAEMAAGREASRGLPVRVTNLCGRLNLTQLAVVLTGLDLLVTPDTGPMHLAAWVGTPVLDLSLGPVNPWETGPYPPGHRVATPALSCTGCWSCQGRNLRCRDKLDPEVVAFLAARPSGEASRPAVFRDVPGLDLWVTHRDDLGLFTLQSLGRDRPSGARDLLRAFWKAFWLQRGGLAGTEGTALAWRELVGRFPVMEDHRRQGLAVLAGIVRRSGSCPESVVDPQSWKTVPHLLRPLGNILQMTLQNGDCSAAVRREVLETLGLLESLSG